MTVARPDIHAAELVAGQGGVGNADQRGGRPVTLLSAERWARVEADLGHPVDPSVRRANALLPGVDLRESRGRLLALGPARLRVTVETGPCWLMDMAVPGLQDALDEGWGAGASARVEVGGRVAVSDPATWLDRPPPG